MVDSPIKHRDLIVPLVLFLAFVVRCGYFLIFIHSAPDYPENTFVVDSARYSAIAEYLLGLSTLGEHDLFFSGPGYGAFIAVIKLLCRSSWVGGVYMVQAAISACSAGVVVALVKRLVPDCRSILWCIAVWMVLSPLSITLSCTLLTETLFVFLLSLGVYALLTVLQRNTLLLAALSGLCFGLASLVRPVGLPLSVVVIVALLMLRLGTVYRRALILFSCMTLLIPGGWIARNYLVHGSATLATVGDVTAASYLSALVRAKQSGVAVQDVRAELAQHAEANLNEQGQDAEIYKNYVVDTAGRYPVAMMRTYLSLLWKNLTEVQYWNWGDRIASGTSFYYIYLILNELRVVLMILAQLLAIAGLFLLARRDLRTSVLLGVVVLSCAASSGVTFWQGPRIYFPAHLAWVPLMAVGAAAVLHLLSAKNRVRPLK